MWCDTDVKHNEEHSRPLIGWIHNAQFMIEKLPLRAETGRYSYETPAELFFVYFVTIEKPKLSPIIFLIDLCIMIVELPFWYTFDWRKISRFGSCLVIELFNDYPHKKFSKIYNSILNCM